MKCIKCGNEISYGAKFCPKCGEPVKGVENAATTEPSMNADTVDLETEGRQNAFLFVGKNQDYYFKKWKKVNTWNWAAFFLAPFWLGYRKMYQYLLILFGAYLAIDGILVTLLPSLYESSGNSISIGVAAFFGIQGNALYKKHMRQQIAKIESVTNDDHDRLHRIEKAGGTSGLGVLFSFGVMIAYALIMYALFG